MTRFLQYPVLELSNNLAENAMRPVVLGRRNWIHIAVGCRPRVAAMFSIVVTCRRFKIPVRDYLGPRLPALSDFQLTESGNSRLPLGRPETNALRTGQRRTGSNSGATSTSMLRATPGCRRTSSARSRVSHHLVNRRRADAEVATPAGP